MISLRRIFSKAPGGKIRRGTYLVDPQLQLRIIGLCLIPAIGTVAISYVAFQLLMESFVTKVRSTLVPDPSLLQQFVEEQRIASMTLFGASAFINLFVILIAGTILSHRLAGPIYRLKVLLKEIAEQGKFTRLSFREADFFQSVVQPYNSAIETVQKIIAEDGSKDSRG